MTESRANRIGGLTLGLLLLMVGCKVRVAGVSSGATRIDAEHAVVKMVSDALYSGEAFKPGFLLFDPSTPAEKAEAMLGGLRLRLHPTTGFTFAEGIEITRKGSGPIIVVLQTESAQHPSMFSLPTQANHFVYVVFEVAGVTGTTGALHVLMWERGGKWEACGLHLCTRIIGKWDFASAFATAQEEEEEGNLFVAACLYKTAEGLSASPPYRTSGLQHRLRPRMRRLARTLRKRNQTGETISVGGSNVEIAGLRVLSVRDEGAYLAHIIREC
jgi:hypothetical protein